MPAYTDQIHRTVEIPWKPQRIISLVPSQTELLHALGLDTEVVGITRFCIHPEEWFRSKTRVGGTKDLHFDRIDALQPDLIIANKEENLKEQVEELAARYPVWISDVQDLEGALEMILQLGIISGKDHKAMEIGGQVRKAFGQLQKPPAAIRSAYLIWQQPMMAAGAGTFIHDMMERAGLENVFGHLSRYPEISLPELQVARPELVLLSSEPYPFTQKHIDALQPFLPGTTLLLADGEMFSWYGSRLLQAPAYFNHLLKALR